MTLKYHFSPHLQSWTRCVAQQPASCPFGGGTEHLDRTGIAKSDGGVITLFQNGGVKESTVTPCIGGIYAVLADNGEFRTYTTSGDLIPAKDRAQHLREVIMPKLRGQSAKDRTDLENALLVYLDTHSVPSSTTLTAPAARTPAEREGNRKRRGRLLRATVRSWRSASASAHPRRRASDDLLRGLFSWFIELFEVR